MENTASRLMRDYVNNQKFSRTADIMEATKEIFRDARIEHGYPVHAIDPAHLRPADLLYFPNHVALYLGENRYLHATAGAGDDGVVINSLDPRDSAFRPDLPPQLTATGSIFPLKNPAQRT